MSGKLWESPQSLLAWAEDFARRCALPLVDKPDLPDGQLLVIQSEGAAKQSGLRQGVYLKLSSATRTEVGHGSSPAFAQVQSRGMEEKKP